MKKIIALLLAMVMMFALCACGTREKENLDTATELLKEAENCIVRASTMLIDHFDVNYQSLMKYYYNVSLLFQYGLDEFFDVVCTVLIVGVGVDDNVRPDFKCLV